MRLLGNNTVAGKLILYLFVFSFLVTLILSAVELIFDYRSNVALLNNRIAQIRDSHLDAIAEHLWNLDRDGLDIQLRGILQLPNVEYIKILETPFPGGDEKDREISSAGHVVSKHIREDEFPLVYYIGEEEKTIGKLVIVSSLSNIYNRMLRKFMFIMLSNTAKIFLVSLFIFFIIRLLVTGYLVEIVNYTDRMDEDGKSEPLRLSENTVFCSRMTPCDELNKVASSINNMNTKLREHSEYQHLIAIGQSTAMVSHDVRKPLASMKALLASLPAIKDDPAQIEKMVAAVDRNIASTNAMLNDVLEFSRDSTALDIAEHSVPGVIAAAASDALRGHPGSDVRIEYRLDHGDTPLRVDGNRVVRVLTNILDNALDAMVRRDSGRSSGTVFISTSRTSRDGKEVVGITIGNDGPDIPSEAMGRLFDPFFTSGKKGGTGLGLAICRRVIALHGGTIEARTRAGGGAEFAIELPAGSGRMAMNASELIRSSAELETFRREEALRQEYGDTASVSEFLRLNKQRGRASSLLIVDDEPLFRETVRHLLEKAGEVRDHVKVIEADSGEMGLKLFEGQGFDYVIADIDLGQGHMSGYEFAREVLTRYAGAHVLIHSNKRRAEMDREIRAIASERFMGFLPKPMRSEELLQFLACKTFEVRDAAALRSLSQKRVLVVNDDDALSFSFKIMLKAPGVQVVEARDVVTALKHLADQKVDVILSDINLGTGEPSGYDLLTAVRGRDRSVPFYVVSGYSRDQEWPKASGMGATGYLQLPVDQEQLKAILG